MGKYYPKYTLSKHKWTKNFTNLYPMWESSQIHVSGKCFLTCGLLTSEKSWKSIGFPTPSSANRSAYSAVSSAINIDDDDGEEENGTGEEGLQAWLPGPSTSEQSKVWKFSYSALSFSVEEAWAADESYDLPKPYGQWPQNYKYFFNLLCSNDQ